MLSRYTILFILLLCSISTIFSQVQGVDYGIKYVSGTSFYDCYFVVNNGFAESSTNRTLNDAQFSIKVETGTSVSIESSSLPFLDNEYYTGSEIAMWSVSESVISPASDPAFDYYSFTPNLLETSRFNDLFQNTEYILFRISVEGSCSEGVQVFRNGIDPGSNSSGMGGKDFSNSMSINSSSNLFSGLDQSIAFGSELRLDDVYSCDGDCVTIEVSGNCDLSNYTFLWSDGSTNSSATVCPDSTMDIFVNVTGDNGFNEQLNGKVNYIEPFVINVYESALCTGGEIEMMEESGRNGSWYSNNTDLAILKEVNSNGAYFTGLKEGIVTFSFVDDETGCVSFSEEITVLPELKVIPLQGLKVKVGESLSFGTSEISGYKAYWDVNDWNTATIYDGVLHGLSSGVCEVSFTLALEYGCISNSITVIVEDNDICNNEEIRIWERVKIGDIDGIANIEASASSNKFFLGNDINSLIIYNGVTGVFTLNEIDDSGQLLDGVEIISNDKHDETKSYELELHDMDSDGLMDIVLLEKDSYGQHNLYCYKNLGESNFELKIEENNIVSDNLIEIVDLDNDGFLDVFTMDKYDEFYRIIFNDNWNAEVIDGTPFEDGTSYWVFTMDINQDGYMDIVYQDRGVLINNGNRTFIFDSSYDVAVSFIFRDRYLYDAESELLIGNETIYSASNILTGEFIKCTTARIGGEDNNFIRVPRFYANINSTTKKEIVVVGQKGFMSLNTSITCDEIGDGFDYFNFGAVASKYNQIDIGNDGYTDFFYLEGNELYASINPNSNTSSTIKGFCYIDKNENGVFDTDESPLRNVKIETDQSDIVILTDDDGKFKLLPPDVDYNLQASMTSGEWTQNILSISSDNVKTGCLENNNFGFVQAPGVESSASVSISNSITRCDFETRFYITIENTGSENSMLGLEFLFDDETTLMSSDILGYTVTDKTLSANLGMLSPFSPKTYTVTLKMPSGSSSLPMLNFRAVVSEDSQILDDYAYMEQLRCSYDPNDKRVFPDREGEENLTLFEEDLEYTIRFQNNGNDTAFVVRIVDPLDPNIEPSSINVISSSHPVETNIYNDTLVFLFEDIYLVDSMTNYALSQGYVTFSCAAKDGIDESTIINNTADIIFDSNEPIITNTTTNTLVSEFCSDLEYDFSIAICSGESYNGYMESGNYQDIYTNANGCDSIVNLELIVSSYETYTDDILLCQGDSILINNLVVTENTTLVDTLENSAGCFDSIQIIAIQFVDKKEVTLDIEICEGDNYEGLTEIGQYTFNLISEQGCDSVVTLNLDVVTPESSNYFLLACKGDSISILNEGYQFFETTQFTDTVYNSNNCAVTYTNIHVTIIDPIITSIDTIICEGENYLGLMETGMYVVDTSDQETGCPITINLDLTVLSASDPTCIVSTVDEEYVSIELFPNPATDEIVLKSDSKIELIEIFDTRYRKLRSMNTNATFARINVQDLTSGIYILRCRLMDQYTYKKLVVR